jgi:hypothetical protein
VTDLVRAVTRMLGAFAAVSPERAEIYVEAVRDEHLCERCATEAARTLTRRAKRRPAPADLLDETRDVMATSLHAQHVPQRAQLGAGEPEGWWRRRAPALVLEAWPDLSDRELGLVCAELQRQASVELLQADKAEVRANLGWVDGYGPTTERLWWQRWLERRRA